MGSSGHAGRPGQSHGGVFKTAAVEVLRRTRRLMTTGEICRLALDWGLLACQGKTPEATMASALYGDIKRKGGPSLFIRPQHGLFGLLEWVQDGSLPLWQLDVGDTALPATSSIPNYAPVLASSGSFAGLPSATSAGFGCSRSSVAVLPLAEAAAVAVMPAKRGPPGGGNQQQRGPGRPKKARRTKAEQSDGEDGEWSTDDSSLSDSRQQDDSDDERLEPKQYSLRKGQVGRLQEAMAAAAPPPLRYASSLDPSAITTFQMPAAAGQQQQQQQGAQQGGQLGGLEPLELPNLRPQSAGCGASQHRTQGRRSSDGGSGLLSPPLYAELLQSPLAAPASAAGQPGSLASLLSPGTALPALHSPMLPSPLLAAMGRTLAGLPSLLSPLPRPGAVPEGQRPATAGSSLQHRAAAALKGSAAVAAGAQRATAPGDAPSAMVPLAEPAAPALGLASALPCQGLDILPILPLQGGKFSHMQQQARQQAAAARPATVGESAGLALLGGPPPAGTRPAHAGIPDIVFKLAEQLGAGHEPASSASSRGGAAGAAGGPAFPEAAAGVAGDAAGAWEAAGMDGPGPAGDALRAGLAVQIARKIREVEGKVRQVEERWGPLSLKTAQAHFLLHRACRHPQAAEKFQAASTRALQRAHSIVQQNQQLGLADCQCSEYGALLDNIHQAALAAGGEGGDVVQAMQPAPPFKEPQPESQPSCL